MRYQHRAKPDRLQQTLVKLTKRYDGTPLDPVGSKLKELISGTQAAIAAASSRADQAIVVTNLVEHVLCVLPRTFGPRFFFDAAVLQALSEEWRQGGAQLSGLMIPCPGQAWGHQSLSIRDGETVYFLDVIALPGQDNLDDINLLSYPFLWHELGHHTLGRNYSGFATRFQNYLSRLVDSLLLRGIADRGSAKDKSVRLVEPILRFWKPGDDHRNWAYEMAIDIMALWTGGPAYLAAFQDEVDKPELNPYQLGQDHPPYEVRLSALIEAANRLGWGYYTSGLILTLENWRASDWAAKRDNEYVACSAPDLISECVGCALGACEELALPRITPARIETIQQTIERGSIPDFGTDLLLGAWHVANQSNGEAYARWETDTIRALQSLIRQ